MNYQGFSDISSIIVSGTKLTGHQDLIQRILDIEWDMFRRVKSLTPASCQSSPDAFRKIRGSIYEMWEEDMLASYLDDLKIAQKNGRNLLTEKYARMDNLIPESNSSPFIDKIVQIESEWQVELRNKYPATYNRLCRSTAPAQDGSNFSVYLRSELETYSHKTIKLYYEHVQQAREKGKNIAMLALQKLIKKGGYHDLDHAERCLSKVQ